jgi:hypothetical protein
MRFKYEKDEAMNNSLEMQTPYRKFQKSSCVYNFSLEYLYGIIFQAITCHFLSEGVIFMVDHRFYRVRPHICCENDRKRSIVVSAEIVF